MVPAPRPRPRPIARHRGLTPAALVVAVVASERERSSRPPDHALARLRRAGGLTNDYDTLPDSNVKFFISWQ